MNEFTARVQRDDGWWVAQLEEDPGVITQVRRLDQVGDAIRDALVLFPELTEAPDDTVIRLALVEEHN